jgi:hypothetical protein
VFTRIVSNCDGASDFNPQFALAWAPFANTSRTYMNIFRTP